MSGPKIDQLPDVVLTLDDIKKIQNQVMSYPLVTEDVTYEDFQTIATIRSLEKYLKSRRIRPQFTVQIEDTYDGIAEKNKSNETS